METTQLKPRFPQTAQVKGTWVFQNTESSRAAQENPTERRRQNLLLHPCKPGERGGVG